MIEFLEPRRLFSAFAVEMGSFGPDIASSAAADRLGNVYVTGTLAGSADFDPELGVTTVPAGGFAAKYDPDGRLVWARSFPGATPAKVALDAAGNVYLAGSFERTVDFDPRRTVYALTSTGGTDGFLCKLNPRGNFMFAHAIRGTLDNGVTALVVNLTGTVYIGGTFKGRIAFQNPPTALDYDLAADENSADGFIASYIHEGMFNWAGSISPGRDDLTVADLALDDDGAVLATGRYSGGVYFGPRRSGFASAATPQAYVLKWDATGLFVWMRGLGGTGTTYGQAIASDRAGNVYTTGGFSRTTDFDPGSGSSLLTASKSGRVFVSKLSQSGNFVWARAMGGSTANDFGPGDVVVDKHQVVTVTGQFSGTRDFDPGAGQSNLISSGLDDIFLSRLDSAGVFMFANKVGGAGADAVAGSTLDRDGNLVIAGTFSGTANFATGGGAISGTSNGDADVFLLELWADGELQGVLW